jgi:hypothetical protein
LENYVKTARVRAICDHAWYLDEVIIVIHRCEVVLIVGSAAARRSTSREIPELRATMSLARLLRDTGRCDEARAMLDDIYNWFIEGFDTADLIDAKAVLDEFSK